MQTKKPPVVATAVTAWGDAFNVIGAMPGVIAVAFAIMIGISLVSLAILPDAYAVAASPWAAVISIVFSIIEALLLAPLAIVVHRYVLLGEATARYPLDPSSTRYMRFVSFAILVKLLGVIPGVVDGFAPNRQQYPGLAMAFGVAILVLFVVVTVIVIRRAILFPAIAIDAPGASWSNARRDTKGVSWRVAFIFVCAALPAMIVGIPLWYLLYKGGFSVGSGLMFAVISAVVEIPTLCAFAAAASRVYRLRADNLVRASS